ncbi:MAG: membrane protein insertase YidC [Spirochaetae bacterium HGW-Spirochaetae-3]|jgi:YidC/Oxa1 family membrane protein insertase|nr:MAG: membrane protein insertase YidC [Spirochaetae bacterium HGW-Spirochaetae-3]
MSINEDDNNKAFDAKTMIAIVLMVVVITVGMAVQNHFFPKQPLPVAPQATTAPAAQAPIQAEAPSLAPAAGATVAVVETPDAPDRETTHALSTDFFDALFSNKGGEIVSLKLKQHKEDGVPVELLLPRNGKTDGFSIALGGAEALPIEALMTASRPGPGLIEFSRTFFAADASGELVPFTLKKRYEFHDGDYMIKLSVTIEGSNGTVPRIGDGEFAYSLKIGPQIGPTYEQLPKNADWRKIVTYENAKRKVMKGGTQVSPSSKASWSAIAGKYFAIIVLPDATPYTATYTNISADGKPVTTSMAFSRPALGASVQTDVFHIYAGPKSSRELARYDDPTANAYKRSSDDLEGVMEGGNILGWLETALKWSLNLFYGMVGNYGIAIILVTILVRLIMFPLTFKGSQSTARMQELQPRIQELQAKYKSNPQKLNQEMAEFYKKEGYNPMSGCLPMLIQFPIFIAMYALFNNHFDLRGASFIAGWINDLSLPEAVYTFPTINLIVWRVSAIRILPIIYVLSQLMYGRLMQQQPTTGQNAGQMKFMMYGMPVMFFFILYDVPSGLLVYWISSNILTAMQQLVINKVIHKKRLAAAAAAPAPQLKLVPKKGGSGSKKGRK